MINDEAYCMDILTQSLAIQKSLSSLNKLLIENHVKTHVSEMLESGSEDKKKMAVNDLLDMYELSKVRGK